MPPFGLKKPSPNGQPTATVRLIQTLGVAHDHPMFNAHSHYENLKVARNAPIEVIRAAYRALAQRYHPDVNKSPDAPRIMRLLNEAWEVLGDPERRAQHDAWILEQVRAESGSDGTAQSRTTFEPRKTYTYTYKTTAKPNPEATTAKTASAPASDSHSEAFRQAAEWAKHRDASDPHLRSQTTAFRTAETATTVGSPKNRIGFLLLGVVAAGIYFSTGSGAKKESGRPSQVPSADQNVSASPVGNVADRCKGSYEIEKCLALERRLLAETPEESRVRRESLESNRPALTVVPKAALPKQNDSPIKRVDPEQLNRTGYVPGSLRAADEGLSEFTVDNARGGGDAIARLYLGGKKPAVRTFFIKRGERFTATTLDPGIYVLRYRYMGSDDTFEADRNFELRQFETDTGTNYSRVRVTLYTVQDGNMRTRTVPKDTF